MSATEPGPELRDSSGWSVGLVNATGLNLGDTLYDEAGPSVKFPPIPAFAPEVFATARPSPSRMRANIASARLSSASVRTVVPDP